MEHKLDDIYLELYGDAQDWGDGGKLFLSILCRHFNCRSPISPLSPIELTNIIRNLEVRSTADVKYIMSRLEVSSSEERSLTVQDLHNFITENVRSDELVHLSFFFDDYKPQYW